ncbi:hypothetical protein AVEN_138172-1 [Araneus ventricosus]|uniref:Uncharacterized protein n=1 Tax=Araneus ventricosus TaxID=182803 RepID=A0A4Y2M0Q9_ARAVE|nr:hypothetical protein AVEN_138172-1 [Araneus ventricosus]
MGAERPLADLKTARMASLSDRVADDSETPKENVPLEGRGLEFHPSDLRGFLLTSPCHISLGMDRLLLGPHLSSSYYSWDIAEMPSFAMTVTAGTRVYIRVQMCC